MPTLATYPVRIRTAFEKIGTVNGTKLPEPEAPRGVNDKEEYIARAKALGEFFVASALKKLAEAREKKARTTMLRALGYNAEDHGMPPGARESKAYGSFACVVEIRNGQTRINRPALFSKLVTDMKLSPENAEKFIVACEVQGKPSMYLTPSTTVE